MVSYYNSLSYPQKHSAANLAYPSSQTWQWHPPNYHTPANQFLSEMDSPHAAHHYYNPHMFHPAAGPVTDWHSPPTSANNFASQNSSTGSAHHMLPHHHLNAVSGGGGGGGGGGGSGSSAASTGSNSVGSVTATTQLNETASSINDQQHIAEGLPSPPITVAGSEIHSPGVPASSSSPHQGGLHNNNNNSPSTANHNTSSSNALHQNGGSGSANNRASPAKVPQCYDWMKKPSYPAQPTPGAYSEAAADHCTNTANLEDFHEYLDPSGKTRTKDKYRVVYTDYQRLELEKEYCTSRYITIRRKTELAQTLSLSERQVKIWFQNRRAKERKQSKKGSDPTGVMGVVQHGDYGQHHMDTKPKLEPGLHLQHSLHPMNAMTMNMPMSLHLHHSQLSAAAAHHSHQLHQSQHAHMTAAAAAAVNPLAM